MNDFIKNKKHIFVISIISIVYVLVMTLVFDQKTFIFPDAGSSSYAPALFDYVICKVLSFVAIIGICCVVRCIAGADRKESTAYKVLLSGLPYLIVILAVAAIKMPQGYLSNDEYSIYNDAVNLTHSTWFNVITPYFYTVALMLIPVKYAPIILKLVIEYAVVGYVTLRSREHYGNKIGMCAYLLFLLYPVIAYTTSAHRLPVYFLLYLLLFSKMLFDHLENRKLKLTDAVWMLLIGAVLTQWRTEGIYLSVLVPILMIIVYPDSILNNNADDGIAKYPLLNKTGKSGAAMRLGTFLALGIVMQYIVSLPQNAFMDASLDDAANDRMKPFYAYTITNMFRNGLDTEKNKEDLMIVDNYLSLDSIVAINDYYADINYEDVLILYKEGFVGLREGATIQDFIDYSDAVKRIFINNPDVFLGTRIGAFCYAALPYHIDRNGTVVSLGVSLVKTLSYNLFIPLAIIFVILILSLIRKRWFDFFVMGGLMCHWFIVFILAPASYFKYYFPIYIMAYFYVLIGLMSLLKRKCLDKIK